MDADHCNRRDFLRIMGFGAASLALPRAAFARSPSRPNVILCMTDDQGWGDTSYNGHKILRTPSLDDMAASGLRFDRFYAASPVCSPTRGSVLTGRHPNRFGCFDHGMPIRKQEVTIARALKGAGYVTGHFGKWHLNGRRGPGKPIPATDPLNPGRVGFDEWASVSNFFDLNPTLSRNGKPAAFKGDGSDIIVDEALKFIGRAARSRRPFLAVIWYGSPHNPHRALPEDKARYSGSDYLGELAAVDRSMGRLRSELRRLRIAGNTLVWFCSDNGSRPPGSTGGLRGAKRTLWEGGIRVPGIMEWPACIRRHSATNLPCSTMDIYPTVLDILGCRVPNQPQPIDGMSIVPLIEGKMARRPKPIPFWNYAENDEGHAVLIDNQFKLHVSPRSRNWKKRDKGLKPVLLYDLANDPKESRDLAAREPERVRQMKAFLAKWQASVRNSLAGKDYK